MELCRDIPQYHLCYEVREIDGSIKALIEKLQTAESALESLKRDLARIEEDLAVKTKSLALDNKCLEIRQKLTNPDLIPDRHVDAVTERISNLSAKETERMSPAQEVIDYDTTEFKANEELGRETANITNQNEAEVMMKQTTKPVSRDHNESMLQTTYNTSYKIESTNLRSGDLARTLGRSQGRYSAEKARREIIVD